MPKKEVFQKIMNLLKPYSFFLFLSISFALLSVIATLYTPILIGRAIDCMISVGKVDLTTLLGVLFEMAILTGITAFAQFLLNICNNHIAYRVTRDVRLQAFSHLEQLPLKYVDKHSHGDLVSRIVTDIDQFSEGLLLGFTQVFTGLMTIVGTLLFMLSLNVAITIVVVVITPLSLFVASFIAKKTFTMFQSQSQDRGEITAFINEIVGNLKVVKAFSYENEAKNRFETINQKLGEHSLKATFYSSLTNPATRFVNGIVYAGVGIFGSILAIKGKISVGQLSSFLTYANQYTKPFNEISGVVTEFQNALASAARVFELMEETPIKPDALDAKTLEHAQGEVSLQEVSFSYQKEHPLIRDFNLSVKKGQRVAIVGPTGCGKSTIINLLMRFYEVDQGTIQIDQTSIQNITRRSLRKNYGMVLQETWLKSGSVRENIAYGKPEASIEEVILAAKEAHAHSFIKRLPEGYDTVLGEDGGNLSAGQKQLLCIARVLLSLPPMLILDEATSSIDTRTEQQIQKAFAKMMQGRTSFVVAHRLSTIQEADVILVMNQGNIVEIGTHEQLLAKQGFYAQLYQSQFAVS